VQFQVLEMPEHGKCACQHDEHFFVTLHSVSWMVHSAVRDPMDTGSCASL